MDWTDEGDLENLTKVLTAVFGKKDANHCIKKLDKMKREPEHPTIRSVYYYISYNFYFIA